MFHLLLCKRGYPVNILIMHARRFYFISVIAGRLQDQRLTYFALTCFYTCDKVPLTDGNCHGYISPSIFVIGTSFPGIFRGHLSWGQNYIGLEFQGPMGPKRFQLLRRACWLCLQQAQSAGSCVRVEFHASLSFQFFEAL